MDEQAPIHVEFQKRLDTSRLFRHNTVMKRLVKYHTLEWAEMVEQGWITLEVLEDGMAVMFKEIR